MNTVEFRDGAVWLIDQTLLPLEPTLLECRTVPEVAEAIESLRVRGAPAIGLAAAFGVALAAQNLARNGATGDAFQSDLREAIERLRTTRPTAVNLFWALERVQNIAWGRRAESPAEIAAAVLDEANRMLAEDEAANRAMGRFGADLIPDGAGILTHCNAGALATGAYGTALGVIRSAHEQGKRMHVWVDETRPLLQGARLTAYELKELGIPCTLITDSMAGHFMASGEVDLCVVGADRIVANGDTANKIGTYGVAVLAHYHHIPFYVAAPTSTIDLSTPSGDRITIEQRKSEEVASFRGIRVAPGGIDVANPAFDVTPHALIAAIVTEHGVVPPNFTEGLARLIGQPETPDKHGRATDRPTSMPDLTTVVSPFPSNRGKG